MTPSDDLKKRLEAALQRTDSLNQTKANLGGQIQAKREELALLVKDIREAGYEPKDLAAVRDRLQAELETMIPAYEAQLDAAEAALATLKK